MAFSGVPHGQVGCYYFLSGMPCMRYVCVLLMLATALYGGTINYESARLERRIQAVKTTEKITLDGRLDEQAWSQAPAAGDFIQNEPKTDEPASETTEVRLLYDQENLYIGANLRDSDPRRLIISELKKDFNRDAGDTFEVVLDTFRDERNGYQFGVNPAGAKWDAQMANEGRETNENWDGIWFVKTQAIGNGWTAEISIPFRTLKFRQADVQTWGINFQRTVRRKNEDSFWSPLPRIYNINRVSLAGTLEGLEGIKPGSNIKIKPYVTTTMEETARGDRSYQGDLGLDFKYGLTSGLTWDFTYNTDFSQVEADEQQINLTRFDLFFPEKREFFLENSGIFQFGSGDRTNLGPRQSDDLILFFSRGLGLSEDGLPIPILAGTRLTGRAGRFELGALNIQQREFGKVDATNFSVGRLRRNILANSDVGVMLVNKEEVDSRQYNRVLGADANFRFGQALSVSSFLAKSFVPTGAAKDLAGRVGVNYKDSTWDLRSIYTSVQEDFVDEMGFVPRLGIRKFANYAGRLVRPQSVRRVIRDFNPHTHLDFVLNRDGNLETRSMDYHFSMRFQDSSWIEVGVNTDRERFSEKFVINQNQNIAIAPGAYPFHEYFLVGRSDASRAISGRIHYGLGPFYGGYKHKYEMDGTFRFSHQLNASFTFAHNNINLPEGHFQTNLLGMRFNYSFSTTMFLNALVQYNNDTRQWNSNVRFNLIHRPLSDFFLVYNERRDSLSGDLMDRALIAKFTYMIAR